MLGFILKLTKSFEYLYYCQMYYLYLYYLSDQTLSIPRQSKHITALRKSTLKIERIQEK